ncbi:hypothetical protein HDV02_005322 [Globomyces sp. JEL0801]|nr:hypothetical protein HDV02_005322 [Globomyces sp. JEL0801]
MVSTQAILLSTFCSLATATAVFKNPLPNWLDETRESVNSTHIPMAERVSRLASSGRASPTTKFRVPAEYEPVSAVVVGYAGYTSMLQKIGQATTNQGGAEFWAVGGPSQISGVSSSKYRQIDLPLDSVWMRDYGPVGIREDTRAVSVIDTVYRHYRQRVNDDKLPSALANLQGLSTFKMPLILDGGNFMVDSYNNLYMTKRTYSWNSDKTAAQVDALLKEYFSIKNIYTFDYAGFPGNPADGTGHIDMFIKLLNDHTVLISTSDTQPQKGVAEQAVAFFTGRTAADGVPFKVITVKGWVKSGVWYTYSNSLIVNNVVIMPSYQGSPNEAAAIAAYKSGMSGVQVVTVPSDESIVAGGSIHCITQNIPVA